MSSSSPSPSAPASNGSADAEEERSCSDWDALFGGLNEFFREEDIIIGSEHSSVWLGNLIWLAYMLVIGVGTAGNLLTIVAVLRNKQMRTVRNFFIVNLALSDFFVCTVTAPTTLYTVLYVFWPFGTTLCKIAGSLQGFNIFLSTFSITAIALDRYVLVIFPTKRQRQQRLSLVFFSLIWLSSILLAAPLFLAADLSPIFRDDQCGIELNLCNEQNERWKELPLSKEAYTVGVIILQYAFPLASIVFAYSRIARRMGARKTRAGSNCGGHGSGSMRRTSPGGISTSATTIALNSPPPPAVTVIKNGNTVQSTAPNNNNNTINSGAGSARGSAAAELLLEQRRKSIADRHRRTNMLLVTLVVVFACAWLPLNIFHLVNTFSRSLSFSVPVFALCHLTAMCSACLNPVSYAFFNQNFRQEFAEISRRLGLLWLYRRLVRLSKMCASADSKANKLPTMAADDYRQLPQTHTEFVRRKTPEPEEQQQLNGRTSVTSGGGGGGATFLALPGAKEPRRVSIQECQVKMDF